MGDSKEESKLKRDIILKRKQEGKRGFLFGDSQKLFTRRGGADRYLGVTEDRGRR